MSVEVSFIILGDEVYADKIEQMGRRARGMSPVMEKIKEQWIDWAEEQFETEGKRSGNPWPQLSTATILDRGSNHPILIRTADLLLETTSDENYVATDEEILFFGTDAVAEYGGYHQSGTSKMPARPIFDFTPLDEVWMYETLQDFLVFGRVP